jgi:hypothetical protein
MMWSSLDVDSYDAEWDHKHQDGSPADRLTLPPDVRTADEACLEQMVDERANAGRLDKLHHQVILLPSTKFKLERSAVCAEKPTLYSSCPCPLLIYIIRTAFRAPTGACSGGVAVRGHFLIPLSSAVFNYTSLK